MMLRIFILLSVLAVATSSTAQNNYAVRLYSTDNGLPSNGIKGLQWDDETGFLWIATEAGVVRFNGIDFKNFTNENTPALTSERMLFLVRNFEGNILTSDQETNIFCVKKNRLALYNGYPRKGNKTGNLFLVAASDSLVRHNLYRQNERNYFLPFDKLIHASDTSCYIHQGNTIYYYSYQKEQEIEFPEAKKGIQSLFRIDNRFFIKDGAGEIYRFNTTNNRLEPISINWKTTDVHMPGNEESNIYWENGMNNPVLFSGTKAWLLTFNNDHLEVKLIAENVPQNALIRFVQYSEKLRALFIGTDSKGLIVISENKVMPLRKPDAGMQERNSYYGQVELANGKILTNEGQVIGTGKDNNELLPVNGGFVFSIFPTRDSLLWYSQIKPATKESHLHCYNYRLGTTKVYDKIVIGLFALAYSNRKIYLTDENGIATLSSDSLHYLRRFKNANGNTIYDMQETEPGILFLATCSGLLRYNTNNNQLDTLTGPNNTCVRTIWKYGDYIFFGTYGKGYFIWKKGEIKPLPLDKNKYLLYTHCFQPDGAGFCWISTNRGLFKVKLSDVINAYEHGADHIYYHYYGKNDGMDITEMNGGCVPCAIMLRNRTLSFPTMDGLLWVNPDKAGPALPTGEIYIDEFIAGNKAANLDSINTMAFPSRTPEIMIRLAYSAWSNKENIYIEYQLNDHAVWKPLNAENEAMLRFSYLPSGNYVLRFRKLNGFGINNYSYKEIRFSINTPWYLSWWFFILVAAFIFGVFLGILQLRNRQYQLRQEKLKKQVAEKTKELHQKNEVLEKTNSINIRLISIISHDIVTPLKFLTVAGKNLLEKRSKMPEELQQETIQEITNTSQDLQMLSVNILNWIKYQNENRHLIKESFYVYELVDGVISILKTLASQKQLTLINDIDKGLLLYQYYEPLKILIYNLVTNSVNFTTQGNIVISNQNLETETVITVRDEGVGMTKEQIANILSNNFIISSTNIDNRKGNGLGYLIVKDLLKMMSASIKIQSEKGKGTSVMIIIPLYSSTKPS